MRLLTIHIFLFCSVSHGKVMDLSKQFMSAYLRGTYGMNKIGKSAYAGGLPANVFTAGAGVNSAYSGEFGFGFSAMNFATLRLGVELLSPPAVADVEIWNASGDIVYGNISSRVASVIPQANLEIHIKKFSAGRLSIGAGGGYSLASVKNEVRLSDAGRTALRIADYIEEGAGTAIMYQAYLGIEFQFVDNLTCSLDVGYRVLKHPEFSSTRDTVSARTTIAKDEKLSNADGSKRSVDFSGPFAGISLRFYVW